MKKRANRQWLMGLVAALLITLVWWMYIYDPARMEIEQAGDEYALEMKRKVKIQEKIKELEDGHSDNMIQDAEVDKFASLMVSGRNLEELNASIQQQIQRFMDQNNITLQKYQVLNSTRWMDYDTGVLEFTVRTNHRGIAMLLKYLEELNQLVRIGRLNINYSKARQYNLNVTFRIETLFVSQG
ncbi:MAG: hypothetical protein HQK66_13060 [Desulfamplus sp.]|nr:hypothetical protein [Desulfamplus sp.]